MTVGTWTAGTVGVGTPVVGTVGVGTVTPIDGFESAGIGTADAALATNRGAATATECVMDAPGMASTVSVTTGTHRTERRVVRIRPGGRCPFRFRTRLPLS